MLTPQIAAARVAQGAAFLDRVHPSWADRINVDTLAMRRCRHCMFGQLYGDYLTGVEIFGWPSSAWELTDLPPVQLGFALAEVDLEGEPHDEDFWRQDAFIDGVWRTLTDAWIAATAERRCAVADGEVQDLVLV